MHIHTSQTHAKSPPGVKDIIPPAETAVDQSGFEVKWHSITEGQLSHAHTYTHTLDADVHLQISNILGAIQMSMLTHKY